MHLPESVLITRGLRIGPVGAVPIKTGSSSETGLVSSWSLEGDNLLWKADFIGRSTPIVLNNRVYVIGRVGMDITEQERVACFDAETGKDALGTPIQRLSQHHPF